MNRAGHRWRITLAAGLLALAACDAPTVAPTPGPNPDAGLPQIPAPSEQSLKLARYYDRLQSGLLTLDMLRTDGGGADTPYTDTDILRNFEQIVFYNENIQELKIEASGKVFPALRKWEMPVRITVEFGASVPEDQRASDAAFIAKFATRLARVSRHQIKISKYNPNFHVLIMGEDDRAQAITRIRQIVPGIDDNSIAYIQNLPRSTECLVVAFYDPSNIHSYRRAIAFIRTENPPLMRQACLHEEITQGLGLVNDSPHARPSIFNDNNEFAALTTHDEELLRLLYNPALTPGMSADQARPIMRQIILGQAGPT